MHRLRREYDSLLDGPPGHIDAQLAVAVARKRRTRRIVAGSGAITSLVVGATVLVNAGLDGPVDQAPPAADRAPADSDPAPSFSVTDWVSRKTVVGQPPELGTLMYRTCVDGCEVKLLRPDGTEYPLAEINLGVAEKIEDSDFQGAALSNDATELGVRVGAGYEVFTVGSDQPTFTAEPGPSDSHWEVSSWGVGTSTLSLVQLHNEEPTAFTQFWEGEPHTYEVEDPLDLTPMPGSGALAQAIDTSVSPRDRDRVTRVVVDSEIVVVGGVGLGPQGTIHRGDGGADFAGLLRADETLAGPRGVPEELSHPGAMEAAVDDLSRRGIKVFAAHENDLAATAVLIQGYPDVPGDPVFSRVDIPASTDGEQWALLGLTRDGVAVTRSPASDDTVELILLKPDGTQELIHELPADAQILLPGNVIRD